jgi:hypothetical protein
LFILFLPAIGKLWAARQLDERNRWSARVEANMLRLGHRGAAQTERAGRQQRVDVTCCRPLYKVV